MISRLLVKHKTNIVNKVIEEPLHQIKVEYSETKLYLSKSRLKKDNNKLYKINSHRDTLKIKLPHLNQHLAKLEQLQQLMLPR
jgi:hypothetical protein